MSIKYNTLKLKCIIQKISYLFVLKKIIKYPFNFRMLDLSSVNFENLEIKFLKYTKFGINKYHPLN